MNSTESAAEAQYGTQAPPMTLESLQPSGPPPEGGLPVTGGDAFLVGGLGFLLVFAGIALARRLR